MKKESEEVQAIVVSNQNSNDLKNSAKVEKSEENIIKETEITSTELSDTNQVNLNDDNTVNEESIQSINQSSAVQKKRKFETEDLVQINEIAKFKEDHQEIKRRRSLRNETAATIKKKPPKYEEIFNCYKRKEYKLCVIYIDLVAESAKDYIEYQILKAACYIHLGIKLSESHKILDDILKIHNSNPFTYYAKGLAYYQEEKWKDCVQYFEKAISLDKSSMERAEVLLKLANDELEKIKNQDEELLDIKTEPIEDEMDDDNDENLLMDEKEASNNSKPNSNKNADRFRCEICDKGFCKKFNLDRHNKVVHNRETPYIPPLPRFNNRRSDPELMSINIKQEEEEEKSMSFESSPSVVPKRKSSQLKIRLGKKIKKAQSMPSLDVNGEMGRCKICKKLYRKGSLARHEVIHTGNKQYKCEECPMAFYQKSDLQRHVTVHSNVFDFECELCDKKFRIKKNLQVHNKRHHSK